MNAQMSWKQFGQQWLVGGLVVICACLDPMIVTAQNRVTRPPIKPPHEMVGPVIDPALEGIQADVVETAKDAQRYGQRGDHTRRHASNLRKLAKYFKDTDLDAQIVAWASAQDVEVFQYQPSNAKATADLTANLRKHGLSTDFIGETQNATPEQRRTILLALRSKGLSDNLKEIAVFFDALVESSADPRIVPIQQAIPRNPDAGPQAVPRTYDCNAIMATGVSLGVVGVISSFFGPIGLLVGLIIATVGYYLNWWALTGCPGYAPGTGPAIPRPVPGATTITQRAPVFLTL